MKIRPHTYRSPEELWAAEERVFDAARRARAERQPSYVLRALEDARLALNTAINMVERGLRLELAVDDLLRSFAQSGRESENLARARHAAKGRRIDLTWEQVKPTWSREFKYYGEVGKADHATGSKSGCSGYLIRKLRLGSKETKKT